MHDAPKKYRSEKLGASLQKLRISEGIHTDVLAHDIGVETSALTDFESGRRSLSEEPLLKACKIVKVGGIDALPAAADALPEITKATVGSALEAMTHDQGMTIADLERKAQYKRGILNRFVRNSPNERSTSLESLWDAAQKLGCDNLADLIVQAAKVPSAETSARLKRAIVILQKEYDVSHEKIADTLGLTVREYRQKLYDDNKIFTCNERPKLPGLFKMAKSASIDDIIITAENLEIIPPRPAVGAALRALMHACDVSPEEIAATAHCSRNDVLKIARDAEDVAGSTIRRLPKAFKCTTIEQMCKLSERFPAVPRKTHTPAETWQKRVERPGQDVTLDTWSELARCLTPPPRKR